ncbi:hypothetical protein ID866_4676 [Astraeus odoratus]|nr:hypothetical protein ID866_4676 [Astraeus odoratus]
MPASISPLALLVPRPQIPATFTSPSTPTANRLSGSSSLPRTPQRSPVASHVFLSPPAAHRNSTDSWNSSNYEFDDLAVVWKDDEDRLLSRTLDALPAHLLTPFNGPVPPSNLLDKIARGIAAAKGPNDWPHTVRATRVKLLELARAKAKEELCARVNEQDDTSAIKSNSSKGEKRSRTPDPSEVFQPRTNTPLGLRRPLYRQSSMDFMSPVLDRHESITRLSNRFQRHDRTLHHPYQRPAHRRRSEHSNIRSFSPSTPSSTTLNSNNLSYLRKSTASLTSASTSSFGSPISNCVPLRPSSLRRASTATFATTSDVQVDSSQPILGGVRLCHASVESIADAESTLEVKCAPTYGREMDTSPPVANAVTPPPKLKKQTNGSNIAKTKPKTRAVSKKGQPSDPAVVTPSTPRTPPPETRALVEEKCTPTSTPSRTHVKKARKGHKPQLSLSSDEEYKEHSKSAKRPRIREPSPSALLASPLPAQPLFASPHSASSRFGMMLKADGDSRHSIRTGRGSETGASDSSRMSTDNDLSTGSSDTAPTSVSSTSLAKNKTPRGGPYIHTQSPAPPKKPVRRNLARNPSMFGPELPNPQKTPESPVRIPVSSPRVMSPTASPTSTPPVTPGLMSASPMSSGGQRPRTLRRAARRIEFASVQPNSLGLADGAPGETYGTLTLGSAFQLA